MTIKEQAFRAQTYLRTRGVTFLRRSQVYELLAAAAGHCTYAAFQHNAVWCDVSYSDAGIVPDLERVRGRCVQLGLGAEDAMRVVESLPAFLSESGYAPVRFDELIASIDGGDDLNVRPDWVFTCILEPALERFEVILDTFPLLLQALEEAAQRGLAKAHLAIAILLEGEAALSDDEDDRFGRELRRGSHWASAFVSFGDVENHVDRFELWVAKHRHHLLAAAQAGNVRALMATAERYGDPRILDLEASDGMDPVSMARIAGSHGDHERARHWLTVAARQGDLESMRELIYNCQETGRQAWVWMHLSRLLGEDLSLDRHVAINEDGSLYDDDLGGPAYVGGGDGIELAPLAAEEDELARREAAALFATIAGPSEF